MAFHPEPRLLLDAKLHARGIEPSFAPPGHAVYDLALFPYFLEPADAEAPALRLETRRLAHTPFDG